MKREERDHENNTETAKKQFRIKYFLMKKMKIILQRSYFVLDMSQTYTKNPQNEKNRFLKNTTN